MLSTRSSAVEVIVGLEASGYSPWFERLLEELGCEVWLGHATEIRRRARWRHKNDRRDAELILDLMLHDEFPRLYLPPLQSREVLRMLRYRQKLIKMRTIGKNSLQALALQSGLAKGPHLFTKAGLQELRTRHHVAGHAMATGTVAAIARATQSTTAGNDALAEATKPG